MKICYLRGMLVGLLLLAFALAGCAAPKAIFPPVSSKATNTLLPGKFVWFDLFTTDTTQCQNFYETLFGWEFRQTADSKADVKTIFNQDTPIGNMLGGVADPGNSQWLSYISIPDVDAALNTAAQNGGTIYREGRDMPNRGRAGVAIDPQGAPFAVLTSSSGDPADTVITTNAWLGAELWTTNVNTASRFYKLIAGYEIDVINVHDKVEYRMLKAEGKRRGGIVSIPWENTDPEWVPFIAVEDVLATVKQVPPLGGKIIIAPDMSVKEGRLAMIADPSGAIFGIHQIK